MAQVLRPWYHLVKKGGRCQWGRQEQTAFLAANKNIQAVQAVSIFGLTSSCELDVHVRQDLVEAVGNGTIGLKGEKEHSFGIP